MLLIRGTLEIQTITQKQLYLMGNTSAASQQQGVFQTTALQECAFERCCNSTTKLTSLHSLILQLHVHAPPKTLVFELLNDKEPIYRFTVPDTSYNSDIEYYTSVKDFDFLPLKTEENEATVDSNSNSDSNALPEQQQQQVENSNIVPPHQSSNDLEVYNNALLERDSIFELTWTFKFVSHTMSAIHIRCNHNRIERVMNVSTRALQLANRVRVVYDHIRCDLVNIELVMQRPIPTEPSATTTTVAEPNTTVRRTKHHEYTCKNLYRRSEITQQSTQQQQQEQAVSAVSLINSNRRYKLIDHHAQSITEKSLVYPTKEERLAFAISVITNLSKCGSVDKCSHEAMLLGYTLEEWSDKFVILSNDELVVVVFRATSTAEDFVTDVAISQVTVPFENSRSNEGSIAIHQGFYHRGANELPAVFPDWLKHLNSDKELFVIGHSLGGSCAMV